MRDFLELFLITFVVAILMFWFSSLSARDRAVSLGSELASRWNLQLLDETVACTKLRLGRNFKGHVQFLRTYEFEVSANGADRMSCNLVILGHQLQNWYIPPYLQQNVH